MRQSAISTYRDCPYKYKLQYIEGWKTLFDGQADNALVIGTALHLGCETGNIKQMLSNYYSNFCIIDDLQINEAIKLEILLPKVIKILNRFPKMTHEYKFTTKGFHGTADLIVHNPDGTVDLYDFKYSNNIQHYKNSAQLHIYKYYLEKFGFKVKRLGFIFIPKTSIRQKKSEDLYQYRKRLVKTLSSMEPTIEYIDYDVSKVLEAFETVMEMLQATEFPKKESKLCDWCQYQEYCFYGYDWMLLRENRRDGVEGR